MGPDEPHCAAGEGEGVGDHQSQACHMSARVSLQARSSLTASLLSGSFNPWKYTQNDQLFSGLETSTARKSKNKLNDTRHKVLHFLFNPQNDLLPAKTGL